MCLLRNELDSSAEHCAIGVLAMRGVHSADGNALVAFKDEVQAALRCTYAHATRQELKALHPLDTYVAYYRRFGSSYHVLLQLESVIQGKSIPAGLPLVQAMFTAELKNMLLTAGHDLERLVTPLHLRQATGAETYVTLGGKETTLVANDLFLADGVGIVSSILKGPDMRTAITAETREVLYTVYAPTGIEPERVLAHLGDIEAYVRCASPNAETGTKQEYSC